MIIMAAGNKGKSTTSKKVSTKIPTKSVSKTTRARTLRAVVEDKHQEADEMELPSLSDSEDEEIEDINAVNAHADAINESESNDDSDSDSEVEVTGLEADMAGGTYGHSVNKSIAGSEKRKTKSTGGNRGIIYVGRIPHGFYEKEMCSFFKQFGDIVNLCIARNKKGKLKHFGFVEFKELEVAKVAQETMNNYLLFGHQLKVDLVDPLVNKNVFANPTKYHVDIDWDGIHQKEHDGKRTPSKVAKLELKFADNNEKRAAMLKEKGIDWEL